MKKGRALYLLAHSLSQSEKRAVTIALASPNGRKGVSMGQLFDVLLEMTAYEEEGLKSHLAGSAVLSNLPALKTRLFDLILDTLLGRKSGRSVLVRIQDARQEAEILHHRGLKDQCLKKLAKGQKLAEDFDRWDDAVSLLKRRVRLLSQTGKAKHQEILKSHFFELERLIEYGHQQNQWFLLHEKYRGIARQYARIIPQDSPAEYRVLANEFRGLPSPAPNDLVASSLAGNIAGMDLILQGDFEKANMVYQKLMHQWQQKDLRIMDQPELYLAIFNHYCGTAIYCGRFLEKHLDFLNQLMQFTDLPEGIRLEYQRVHYFQLLYFYSNFGVSPETVHSLIQELSIWLDCHGEFLGQRRVLSYCSNILSYLFMRGDFSAAKAWVEKIQDLPNKEERPDIRQFAQLIDWVIRLEKGDDLLEQLQRPLSGIGQQNPHQISLAESLRKLLKVLNERLGGASRLEAVLEFQAYVRPLGEQPGRNPVGYSELLLWSDAILREMSITDRFVEEQQIQRKRINLPVST